MPNEEIVAVGTHIHAPERFVDDSGSFTIRTPISTVVIHGKQVGEDIPFQILGRHYITEKQERYEFHNPDLAPDKLKVKKWGEDGWTCKYSVCTKSAPSPE